MGFRIYDKWGPPNGGPAVGIFLIFFIAGAYFETIWLIIIGFIIMCYIACSE